jgi:hypothetical protein
MNFEMSLRRWGFGQNTVPLLLGWENFYLESKAVAEGCAQISGRWHNRDSPAGEPVFFGDMPWNGF